MDETDASDLGRRRRRRERAVRTMKAMLRRRGFVSPENADGDGHVRVFAAENDREERVLVVLDAEPTLDGVRRLMKEFDERHVILVTTTPLSHEAKKLLRELGSDKRVETFLEREVQFDIMTSDLMPEIRLLGSDELDELRRRHGRNVQFASMCLDDPVCRYFDARVGDHFVSVDRTVPTTPTVYVRRVVEGLLFKDES